jgi:hypothetical protein
MSSSDSTSNNPSSNKKSSASKVARPDIELDHIKRDAAIGEKVAIYDPDGSEQKSNIVQDQDEKYPRWIESDTAFSLE